MGDELAAPAPHDKAPDLLVKGEGGDIFGMDVPTDPGRREVFDYLVDKGVITVLEGTVPPPPAAAAPTDAAAVASLEARLATLEAALAAAGVADPDAPPKKNASLAVWQDYALAHGADRDEVEDLTRDELIERYAPDDDEG